MRILMAMALVCVASCATEKLAQAPPAGVDLTGHWKLNDADSDDPQRLLLAQNAAAANQASAPGGSGGGGSGGGGRGGRSGSRGGAAGGRGTALAGQAARDQANRRYRCIHLRWRQRRLPAHGRRIASRTPWGRRSRWRFLAAGHTVPIARCAAPALWVDGEDPHR